MWNAPHCRATSPSCTSRSRQSTSRAELGAVVERATGDVADVVLVVLAEVGGVRARHGAVLAHPRDGHRRVEAAGERDADALADREGDEDLRHRARHATGGPVRPRRRLLAWVCTICVYSCAMNERHRLIAVILDRREVTSQQQLVELLAEQGVAVTQATVSRDLDRLGAVRVAGTVTWSTPCPRATSRSTRRSCSARCSARCVSIESRPTSAS